MTNETDSGKKERLAFLRRQARELAKEIKRESRSGTEEDQQTLKDLKNRISGGHLPRAWQMVRDQKISLPMAARQLQQQIIHDELDMTLPNCPADRISKIISIFMQHAEIHNWTLVMNKFLNQADPADLLDMLADVSWDAYEENKTLRAYFEYTKSIPKAVVRWESKINAYLNKE
ncbi:hypothetical protein [Bdellovibrio sp.]|uniref:hypothetical protein n=1 Tax=Bdellovibrio sp. TaxID=28201 RepID=UPI0032220BCA